MSKHQSELPVQYWQEHIPVALYLHGIATGH
jgi:hypothetical protein